MTEEARNAKLWSDAWAIRAAFLPGYSSQLTIRVPLRANEQQRYEAHLLDPSFQLISILIHFTTTSTTSFVARTSSYHPQAAHFRPFFLIPLHFHLCRQFNDGQNAPTT